MNKLYFLKAIFVAFFISFSIYSFAGDTPCSATPLANNMTLFETYSNLGNTDSGVDDPTCGNYVTADIWFSVTGPTNGMLDIVTLAGGLINGAMAFYEGSCGDLTELYCTDDDNCGNSIMPIMQLDNLTPGATYYIRIWAENGAPNGDFEIRVSNGPIPIPPIPTTALVGTAFNTNINGLDCVQLTTESAGQAGCAWDPDQIDMSQPFDETFNLNFGNSDAGADGICWVFQSDPAGLNACGTTGQNIAGNISNSFIIEMDTYDNGPGFGDIPNDHVAINVNGNMGAPINGAVSLGNIEDGQDHLVRVVWNPGSNFYEVYFDDVLQISGVYDIINNCLNGNPFCYWGFTGSTGGAVNNQYICPVAEPQYPAGDEVTVEVEICEGESYFAGGANQTTSGLYSDYYFSSNGCDSIINTDLTVIPSSTFEYDAAVCIGDCEILGGTSFCNSGSYEVVFPNANYQGCDSIVTLNLTVLDPLAVIWPPDPIDCFNTTSILDGTLSTSGPGQITYSWTGPDPGCILSGGNSSIALVDCPGTYILTIEQTLGNVTCTNSTSIMVIDNGQLPDADAGMNQTLNCEVACVIIGGTGSSSGPNISYSWVGPNSFISGEQFPFVCDVGIYTLSVIDLNTGCISTDMVEVDGNIDPPIADAGIGDTLTCDQTSVTLDGSGSSSGPEFSYEWTNSSGTIVGTDQTIDVSETGVFTLVVTNTENGCTALSTVEIIPDDNLPIADSGIGDSLTCVVAMVILDGSGSSSGNNITYEWLDSANTSLGDSIILEVNSPGTYTLIVTDTDNGCSASSTVEVGEDLESPEADAGNNETLTCDQEDVTLQGVGSGANNLSFEWQNSNGDSVGNDVNLIINQAGVYTFIVTNTNNGCTAQDTAEVLLDANVPVADAGNDALLTCEITELTLDGSNSTGSSLNYEWQDDNGNTISDSVMVNISTPGIYTLFVTDIDNGCSSSSSVEISEDITPPNAEAGENTLLNCIISEIILDGSTSSGGPNLEFEWQNSSTEIIGNTDSVIVSETDTYTLIVTNLDNGCTASDMVEVNPDYDAPVADAGPEGLLTCLETEVILDGSASTGSDSLSFEWFDENNNSIGTDTTLNIDIPGDYTLVVTDQNNGCTESSIVTVDENLAPPSADAGENASLTCDISEVTLTGSGSGNPGGVSFEWQDSSGVLIGTQASVMVSETGIFTLIVTDLDNGCTASSDVEVVPDVNLPNADAGAESTLTCVVTEVTLDGSNSSSGINFTYEWLDGNAITISTDQNTISSTPGIYTLIVTNNDNGCTAASSVEILEDVVAPIADAGLDGILTCDVTSISLDGSNSSGIDLSYEWFNESNQPVGNQMLIQVSETGEYTLVVTENSNGCTASSLVTVTPDDNLPTPVAIPDGILTCGNTSVIIDGSSSTSISGNLSYEWQDAAGNTISINDNINVVDPGNYILIITDLDNGCTASATEFIDQDIMPPTAEAGEAQTLTCIETIVTLTGSAYNGTMFSCEWRDESNNLIGTTDTINVSQEGEFTYIVINNENGCSASATVNVDSDIVLPVAEAGSAADLTCIVENVSLDGNASSAGPDFSYEWQDAGNATIGTDIQTSVFLPGIYTLIVTDESNGCTAEDEVTVLEDITPPIAFINTGSSTDLDCNNESTVLDGTGSSPANQLSFLWTTNDGNISVGADSPNPEVDAQGTYILTVTNLMNGCTDTESIEIFEDLDAPIIAIDPPQILTCDVSVIVIPAYCLSVGNFSFTWSTNDGNIISGQDTLQPVVDQPGDFTITVTNVDNGCQSTAQITVDQDITAPTAVANVDDQFDCVTESVTLDGTGSSVGPNFTYNWTGNSIIDNASSLIPTVYEPGNYSILVTNLNNGCTQTADVVVEQDEDVPSAADIQVAQPPCYGDPASITFGSITGGDGPYLYSIDGGENFSPSNSFTSLDPGTYNILIQDAKGCEYEDVVFIEAAIELILNVEREVILGLGDDYQINAFTNIPPSEIDTIIWSPFAGLDCINCLDPRVDTILNEIEYTVTVIDTSGCSVNAQIMLRVDKIREVYIPNAFSPNNDGINDEIMIFANADKIKQINTFRIFDRWGEIVFEANDFQPNDPKKGWDGILKGEKLNPAVFVYFAEIEFIDGVTQIYKGDVTLMK